MLFQKTKLKTKSMIDFLSPHFFFFINNIIELTMRQQNFEYTKGEFH